MAAEVIRSTALVAWDALPPRRSRLGGGGTVMGRRLAELFTRLGPAYLKLGQLLATRRDLLPDGVTTQLDRLLDDLPPMRGAEARAVVQRDLGRTIGDLFATFGDEPLGSGSIACVYRATLRDGRVVAVKVRRPGVAAQIAVDVSLIRLLARCIGRLPGARHLPVFESVDELARCVSRQTDFGMEAEANRRLRRSLSSERRVVVPALVDELCAGAVLTMEYLPWYDRHAPGLPSGEAQRAVVTAVRALYRMIFVEGFIHCDLHPANLALVPGGRIALIDFGFMTEMPRDARLRFAEFFYSISKNDGRRCAEIALAMADSVPRKLDGDAFGREIARAVEAASGSTAGSFQVAGFVAALFDIQRRHRVRSTSAFQMAVISLLVLEGLIKQAHPELDFQREARPFILRASLRPSGPGRTHVGDDFGRQAIRTSS